MYNKWLFSLSFLLVFTSCKKEVQPGMAPLNQGCDCAKEVTADFQILEVAGYGWDDELDTETDTIFYNKNVYFVAKEENASYTWIIGSETLTGKKVGRYFDETTKGHTISVTLIVKKKPNTICLPNDDGIDTLTKTFFVANKMLIENSPTPYFMEGTYRVKDSMDVDSIDIIFDYYYNSSQDTGAKLINYDGKNTERKIQRYWANYRAIRPKDGDIYGIMEYKVSGEADFNLHIYTDNVGYRHYHFKGRKL